MATIRSALIAAAGLVLISAGSASAQDTGLAGIHEWVRVGGKICTRDHFHSGASAGEKTRKSAEAAAIGSWQGFTGWEYGAAWGSFKNAESKSIKCEGGGTSWGCTVDARPCRRR
jgi:hypothetical protein